MPTGDLRQISVGSSGSCTSLTSSETSEPPSLLWQPLAAVHSALYRFFHRFIMDPKRGAKSSLSTPEVSPVGFRLPVERVKFSKPSSAALKQFEHIEAHARLLLRATDTWEVFGSNGWGPTNGSMFHINQVRLSFGEGSRGGERKADLQISTKTSNMSRTSFSLPRER